MQRDPKDQYVWEKSIAIRGGPSLENIPARSNKILRAVNIKEVMH